MSQNKINAFTKDEFKQIVDVFTLLAKWRDEEKRKIRTQNAQVEYSNQFIGSQSRAADVINTFSERTVADEIKGDNSNK